MEVKYFIMILGMAVVTFIPRYLPLALLSKFEMPEIIIAWLRYIPAAILAALLFPGILMYDGEIVLTVKNVFLFGSLPTVLVAIYKKNIFLTVIVGMITVYLLTYI